MKTSFVPACPPCEVLVASGAPGFSAQFDVASVFEDAVEEGFGEVVVVEDTSPLAEWLVGGEDGWSSVQVAGVDDGVEDVGGVFGVGQIAEFVPASNPVAPLAGCPCCVEAASDGCRCVARPR